jgi:hypothetical protein
MGSVFMETELIKGLANNGPWAAVAGLLLWQVIKAWTEDRKTASILMSEFRASIDALRVNVEALKVSIDKLTEKVGDCPGTGKHPNA